MASVYALMSELPGSKAISACHLSRLSSLLCSASKGRYVKEKAIEIRDVARNSTHAKMVKRGSKYLRFALFNAAKYVCHWDTGFHQYLDKKHSEGKAYNVSVSHVAKKLTSVLFHLVKANEAFVSQA